MEENIDNCPYSSKLVGNLHDGCSCTKNYDCESNYCLKNLCIEPDTTVQKMQTTINYCTIFVVSIVCIILISYLGYLATKDLRQRFNK
jgi:hypothetical protein